MADICLCLQLHVQDLNVRLACYDPWALRIINCCKSLLLLDTREAEGQTAESSEVIAIQKHLLTQVILAACHQVRPLLSGHSMQLTGKFFLYLQDLSRVLGLPVQASGHVMLRLHCLLQHTLQLTLLETGHTMARECTPPCCCSMGLSSQQIWLLSS